MRNKLYMVIPCYNEQEVLPETSKRLKEKLSTLVKAGKIDPESRIIFVNDGSKTGHGRSSGDFMKKTRFLAG